MKPGADDKPSPACAQTTVGVGNDTKYWATQHRTIERKDLGHKCRECKQAFAALGAPLVERRGARMALRYHGACFSGFADPRSQAASSHHAGKWAGSQSAGAPVQVSSKMRASSHF